MTQNEFRIAVAESPKKEWLDERVLNLNYPYLKISRQVKGAIGIYDFITKNFEGFSKYENLPPEFETVKRHFSSAKNTLEKCLNTPDFQEHEFNKSLNIFTNSSYQTFLFDAPETIFLIAIFNDYPNFYTGAYEYIINGTPNATNKNHFTGYLMAYEFISKDSSEILKRKKIEEKSINDLRLSIQKQVEESEEDIKNYIAKTYQSYNEYAQKIDSLKAEKEEIFTSWYTESTKTFTSFHVDSQNKIKALESLYEEKLKLEAPAQYWSKRAAKLRLEGFWWLTGLIVCLILGVLVLMFVLNKTADGTLKEIFKEVGTAVKWSVVLITLISFLAFGIRTFAKLMFSSFHLSRDAEEREQLTYVYLSLQKDKAIDSTERHMIMQSLFSRADSGLLKDDSGPTMPGNIMDQIAKGGK